MHINEITAQLDRTGIPLLLGAANNGVHTLPDGLTDVHTQLLDYIEEHADHRNRIDQPKEERAIGRMLQQLGGATAFGNAEDIIIDHLQPSLDRFLIEFRETADAAGKYAQLGYQDGSGLLTETDDVRKAYIKLTELFPKYSALRASWLHLRPKATGDTIDPMGLNSPLAEVANLPDLVPNWQMAAAHRAPWPWPANVFHVRMGWLLDHDAHIWLPTRQEQDQVWQQYNPGRRAIAA
ncbi:hypothetical protein OG426_16100 [Streptomyces canus]|uniref:hypothetical protein n=1 Tax=Streptomyces canus TaxID=58343 RepID=UPI003865E3BC|nr:hypothetical protein OG426_16100 [Streptomyces canus]